MDSTEKYVLLNPAFLSGDNSLCVEFPDCSVVKYVPERTCRNKHQHHHGFWCSECDAATFGDIDVNGTLTSTRYCPNCGARVKEESCER